MTDRYSDLFHRHPDNPVLTHESLPYPCNSVFNPAATLVDGETLLLVRVEDRTGLSHLTVARSRDGFTDWRIGAGLYPDAENHPEEIWGIEDARITRLQDEDRWIVAYTAFSKGGPLVSLASTTDFETFDRLGPATSPDDKDAALFPVKFDGRWALIHRPAASAHAWGAHMWISYSPDLKHWGDHQILLRARQGGWWDANKIGLSPQPLLTDEGWLILYHGVRTTAAGCLYRLGLALFDRDDPRRVLRRSREWIFSPIAEYERSGDVGDVVFPCGWTLVGDELRIYYGAADTSVAIATASLRELLQWLDDHHSAGD